MNPHADGPVENDPYRYPPSAGKLRMEETAPPTATGLSAALIPGWKPKRLWIFLLAALLGSGLGAKEILRTGQSSPPTPQPANTGEPFIDQAQMAEAREQLERDRAASHDLKAELARYQCLADQGLVTKQQVDTQAILVNQNEAMIKKDEARIEAARLQLNDCQISERTGYDSLVPYQFFKLRLPVETRENRALIPFAAIQWEQRGAFVYVVKPDQTVEIRRITIGCLIGNHASIESGLVADEQIVIMASIKPGD